MSERHSDQIAPFEINDVSSQFFGDHKMIGNLTGETRIPERREELRRRLLGHDLDYVGRRNKAGAGKSFQNCTCAEEVVAVAVRRVDRRQVLAARLDPIHERACLLDGDKGVDKDGVALAGDESRRHWRPQPLCRAWGQVARDSGDAGRHEHVPVQVEKFAHVCSPSCRLFAIAAVPARSTRGYRVGNGGVQFLSSHTCPGSAPPPHPPASPRPSPIPSWVRYPPVGPARLQDALLAGGRSAGASCGARQYAVLSCMSSALPLSWPLRCL